MSIPKRVWIAAYAGGLCALLGAAGLVCHRHNVLMREMRKPPPDWGDEPLPCPPIDDVLLPGRVALIGTITQPMSRRGWDPSVLIDLDVWLSNLSPTEMRSYGYSVQSDLLDAHIGGRCVGHSIPAVDQGRPMLIIVQRPPHILQLGGGDIVINGRCELLGVYELSDELIEWVRERVAENECVTL